MNEPDEPDVLVPVDPDEVAEALCYALRFDDRGQPIGRGYQVDARMMADRLVRHLWRVELRVLRGPARLGRSGS